MPIRTLLLFTLRRC